MKPAWYEAAQGEMGVREIRHNGRAKHSKGYILIKRPNHHRTDSRGYVFEHILVIEQVLGRELEGEECVHHKNHIKHDNSPENLQLCKNNAEHKTVHMRERALAECGHADWRKCMICGEYDDPSNLYINPKTNKSTRHRECWKKFYSENREHFNEMQRIRRANKCRNLHG